MIVRRSLPLQPTKDAFHDLAKPDGLLFDLDGTLVESMPDLRDALDGALKHHGGVGVQTEQILNWIGDGVRTLVARGVSQSVEPSTAEALCEQVHHTFRVMYLEGCCRKSYLLSVCETCWTKPSCVDCPWPSAPTKTTSTRCRCSCIWTF